ncbi:MAG: S8 family serine peptidase [Clostridia bacterium]|nr:S8 family serine peptidase [Clostridia bacterium]MBQ9507331.1 S8 family serine peptidase [Clostridia bacterium]MBR5422687.1 S8 family serine peptidase [Clostridia bacterium]
MKKVLALLLTIWLLFLNSAYGFAQNNNDIDYSLTHIGVVIRHDYSVTRPMYKLSDFSEDLFKEIIPIALYDMTDIEGSKFNKDVFCDILMLELKNKGDSAIDKALKAVLNLNFVKDAGRCYYRHLFDVASYSLPNDTLYSDQYALETIDAIRAWGLCESTDTIKIGVIDSGISEHADLTAYSASYPENMCFTTDNNLEDYFGHGTHVAGIIGATINNALGVAGTAKKVELINFKITKTQFYPFGIKYTDVIPGCSAMAIMQAGAWGLDIVNCSYGDPNPDTMEQAAIDNYYYGLVIASAGNDGNTTIMYPAGYNNNRIITVGATDINDDLWSNSNYGTSYVDIAAPGVAIKSTIPDNDYDINSGTSMATPFVTAVAAMIYLESPATIAETKSFILDSADAISSLSGYVASGRRLNAFEALRSAMGYLMGDVDFDENVTAADARLIDRCADGLETFTSAQLVLADMDKDGYVTLDDALIALVLAAG